MNDMMYVASIIKNGDLNELEEIKQILDDFPFGWNEFGVSWMHEGVTYGALSSIKWMLMQQPNLTILESGYSVLHTALDRAGEIKYEVLQLLLDQGAPVNIHGINDWTPAHMAAAYEDLRALEILIQYGADLSIKTRIDDYANVLEEARLLNKHKAVSFLECLKNA